MNILACTDYYLPHKGGVEIAAANLYQELAKQGHTITVLCLGSGESGHENITIKEVPRMNLTAYLGLQSSISPRFIGRFRTEFTTGEYDLLHLHNRFFFTSTIAALLSSSPRPPIVFSLHTSRIDMYSGPTSIVARIYENTVSRLVLRKADYVICNSEATAAKAQSLGVRQDSIDVHRHGVDADLFSPSFHSSKSNLSIVFVGRLIQNKGVRALTKIFEHVRETVPNARLEIVGDGPLKTDLKKDLSGYGSSVTFHGSVDREEVASLLRQSTVFCLPSKSEGLSLTTLEAMAAGVPVVVSDRGGLQEIVQQGTTGYRLPQADTEAFAERIINLWQQPDKRQTMGRRAREYVLANHSWQKRAKKIESLFEQLVRDHG